MIFLGHSMKDTWIFLGREKKQRDFLGLQKKDPSLKFVSGAPGNTCLT